VAIIHAANSATTVSGALDPPDKVCGHLFRRLEADRRPKGLAGPPNFRGLTLGTPRIYIKISRDNDDDERRTPETIDQEIAEFEAQIAEKKARSAALSAAAWMLLQGDQ